MAVEYSMLQTQTVRLALTQEMRQSLVILQLPIVELNAYLERELERNPVLEKECEGRSAAETGANDWRSERATQGSSGGDLWSQLPARTVTLEAALLEQLYCMQDIPPLRRRIAAFLAGNLDSHGYLRIAPAEAAALLQAPLDEVMSGLELLRSLEPAGVASLDLADCLLRQLARRQERCSLAERLVQDGVERLASSSVRSLAVAYQTSTEELRAALRLIRSLQPRPGAGYGGGSIPYAIPDVILRPAGEGGQWQAETNDAVALKLTINAYYERLASNQRRPASELLYLEEHLHSARQLLRCVEQRRATLLSVAAAMVERQPEFLRKGWARLRPMQLKDIAERLGVHESTVSRAVSGKYMQTPLGVCELKSMFSTALPGVSGQEAVSAESIRCRLKGLISGENGHKPYSDQRLAELLSAEGYAVARRTVAKYREQLGIAPAGRRSGR